MNVGLIRESFEAIKPHAIEVIEHFYEDLFDRYPQSKELFKRVNLPRQQRALVNSLARIVEFIEDSERLTAYLQSMGKRHYRYGTQSEHFVWVGESLLATFAYYFDAQWTPELAESWQAAFVIIATEMQKGMNMDASKASQSENGNIIEMKKDENVTLSLRELAKKVSQELFKQAIEEELANPEFQKQVQNTAKLILRNAIEAEAQKLLSDAQVKVRTA